MKRIKQINESKQLIFEGFMRLLKSKDYNEITISMIAEESGVTRMTFYRHFKEKEDIFLYAFELSLEKVIDSISKKNNPEIYDLLLFRFRTIKNSPYTEILSKYNKLNKLFQTVGKDFSHHFEMFIPEMSDNYIKVFVGGGLDSMTELWINNGMQESPEEMAEKTLTYLKKFTDNKV